MAGQVLISGHFKGSDNFVLKKEVGMNIWGGTVTLFQYGGHL